MEKRRQSRVSGDFRIPMGNDEESGVCVTYDAVNVPKEKRDLIEKAAQAFLNQAEEILNLND